MHLILGRPDDSCSTGVLRKLRERGLPARLLADPLAPPTRFAWRLDDTGLENRLALDGLTPTTISSVLVRDAGWLDPAGWDPADHAYMQAETRAVLLAWLAGLPCPVINRAPAALWYRARMSVLSWRPLLRRVGLRTPETLLTNDSNSARGFARELEVGEVGGAVCTPLTGDAAWLITGSNWSGLAELQKLAPTCLTEPHGPTQCVCVVGDRIIWDGIAPPGAGALEPRFMRLAQSAGLDLLEIAVAPVRRGLAVVLIEQLVQLDHFQELAREAILDALVDLLAAEHLQSGAARQASS